MLFSRTGGVLCGSVPSLGSAALTGRPLPITRKTATALHLMIYNPLLRMLTECYGSWGPYGKSRIFVFNPLTGTTIPFEKKFGEKHSGSYLNFPQRLFGGTDRTIFLQISVLLYFRLIIHRSGLETCPSFAVQTADRSSDNYSQYRLGHRRRTVLRRDLPLTGKFFGSLSIQKTCLPIVWDNATPVPNFVIWLQICQTALLKRIRRRIR